MRTLLLQLVALLGVLCDDPAALAWRKAMP